MIAHDSRWSRLLRFPVVRIVLAIAFVVVPVVVVQTALGVAHLERTRAVLAVALCLGALLGFFGYHAYVRLVERRAVAEFATDRALPQLIAGLLMGTLLFASTIGVLAALGHYRVSGAGMWLNVVVPLAGAVQAGVLEEILLWFPIGVHVAWNFVQGGVFGVAVSGTTSRGLLQGTLDGPVWLSGGDFGAEASIVAIAICLSVAVVLLAFAARRQHTVAPSWRHPGVQVAALPANPKE